MNYPTLTETENHALDLAFHLALRAQKTGDVPVGAVILTPAGQTAGLGLNQRETPPHDPTAHAEIVALREAAGRLETWNLTGCTLIATLEPCTMCAGAIIAARISRLIFAAWDPKAGACGSTRDIVRDTRLNHQVEVIGGIKQHQSTQILQEFFRLKRKQNQEQK